MEVGGRKLGGRTRKLSLSKELGYRQWRRVEEDVFMLVFMLLRQHGSWFERSKIGE